MREPNEDIKSLLASAITSVDRAGKFVRDGDDDIRDLLLAASEALYVAYNAAGVKAPKPHQIRLDLDEPPF